MLGLLHADFRAKARSFDKSRKPMILQQNLNITCIFKFSHNFFYAEFYNRLRFSISKGTATLMISMFYQKELYEP